MNSEAPNLNENRNRFPSLVETMPRHKTPLRLKTRCVTSIARNMDLWCADFVVRGCNVDSHRHRVDNRGCSGGNGSAVSDGVHPLEFLPSDLVVDIMKALTAEKRLKRRYLEFLLHERVHQLDLSLCNKTLAINDSLIMAGMERNLAGYTATQVARGWAGALGLWAKEVMRKPAMNAERLCYGRPNGPINPPTYHVTCARLQRGTFKFIRSKRMTMIISINISLTSPLRRI